MASTHQRALGVFPNRTKTASALQALRDSGFSMSDTSVITRDAKGEADIAGVDVKEKVGNRSETGGAVGAAAGGVLGGIAGLLVGLGSIVIPGVGPALLAGEAATALTTIIGAAGGAVAGSLVGALIGLGVPEHRAKEYSDRVAAGEYLVMLKGTEVDLKRAEQVLKQHDIEDWGIYDASDRSAHHNTRSAPAAEPYRRERENRGDRDSHTLQSGALLGQRRVMGVFSDWQTMENALDRVREKGLPLSQAAIAVRDDKRNADYLTGGRDRPLGGVTGMLSGLNRVDIPGLGSVLIVGPETSKLVREAHDGRVNDISHALSHLGIAEDQANMYGRRIADGDFLLTLRGSGDEVQEVASLLGHHGMRDWGVYDVRSGETRRD